MKVESIWYDNKSVILIYLLTPFSWLFRFVSQRRAKSLKAQASPYNVPVIVVGNITVGGTGKTPMIQWLATTLEKQGHAVAIVSRGYGGKTEHYPLLVSETVSVQESGDEPKLLSQSLSCPVVVDPDRDRAIKFLLSEIQPDVILSDDGLQHYKMFRDMEIIMLDGSRGLGNRRLLPAGPLREMPSRLEDAAFVLAKLGQGQKLHKSLKNIELSAVVQQQNGDLKRVVGNAELLPNSEVIAIAGIGNPQSFYNELRFRGYRVITTNFPDHHNFTEDDFDQYSASIIIMTEKDWVKCESLRHKMTNVWILPLEYQLPDDLKEQVLTQIHQLIAGKK